MDRETLLNAANLEEKEASMMTIRNSLISLENETMMLRKMLSDAQIEKDLLERKHEEVKLQNQ